MYPVGSIYINVNNTNPSTFFGGTWVQIEDSFLLSAGSTYVGGDVGGSASTSITVSGTIGSHTLTTDEIPSHNHGLNSHTHSLNSHTHSLNGHTHSIPNHTHTYWFGAAVAAGNVARAVSGQTGAYGTCETSGWSGTTGGNSGNTGGASGNTGGASGNTANRGGGGGHNHTFTGDSATINTLPPYLVVYVWQRTA